MVAFNDFPKKIKREIFFIQFLDSFNEESALFTQNQRVISYENLLILNKSNNFLGKYYHIDSKLTIIIH